MPVSVLWKILCGELDKLNLDDDLQFIESTIVKHVIRSPLELNTQMCLWQEQALKAFFKTVEDKSIIEVGAGYGNLCYNVQKLNKLSSYTIVDTSSMLRLAKKFLGIKGIKCNFVDIDNYKMLEGKKFDIFISNVCLSEIPRNFCFELLHTILPNCSRMFVIDIDVNVDKNFMSVIEVFKESMSVGVTEDTMSGQRNHVLYIGRNKNEL